MEEKKKTSIQRTQPTGLATLPDTRIIKAVYQYNQLRAYSLTDIEIAEWARSLERMPDLDLEALDFAIEQMKRLEIPYDKNLGIQNIFHALKHVEKTESGYRVLKAIY